VNDLVMLCIVRPGGTGPRLDQGLHDFSVQDVLCKRECMFTSLDWDECGLKSFPLDAPVQLRSKRRIKQYVVARTRLYCRWLHFNELSSTSKICGGETRRLYAREVAAFTNNTDVDPPRALIPRLRTVVPTRRTRVLTLGDGFCGCGAVSKGAEQAGYHVRWGLDSDETAMAAYHANFPYAQAMHIAAEDLPDVADPKRHGCNHVHMSCPCQPWSMCQYVPAPSH
jgi:DNA (cytosine-5)-methyltransferase 1